MKIIQALVLASITAMSDLRVAAEPTPGEAPGAKARCTAERIETVGNDTSIATGNAECSFGSFSVRADQIEVQGRPEVQNRESPVLVMARGHVVLQQGERELALHTLTLETDRPR